MFFDAEVEEHTTWREVYERIEQLMAIKFEHLLKVTIGIRLTYGIWKVEF